MKLDDFLIQLVKYCSYLNHLLLYRHFSALHLSSLFFYVCAVFYLKSLTFFHCLL